MYTKLLTFSQLMQFVLYMQYCAISVPIFTIKNNKTLVIKKASSWLEIVILCSVSVGQLYALFNGLQNTKKRDFLHIFAYAFAFVSVVFTWIGGWEVKTKSDHMISVFEKIKALDEAITLENNQLHHLAMQVTMWSASIIVTMVTTFMLMTLYGTSLLQKLFGVIVMLRLNLMPAAYLIQFFTLMTLVRYYLEVIDKQLSKIRKLNLDGKEECKPYINFRPHFRDGDGCRTANNIENIRKLYGRVHDLKRDINEVYNMRLWVDITGMVLKTLYFIYSNVMTKWNEEKIFNQSSLAQYYLNYWVVFLMLKFLENIRICGKVTACGKNLGIRVHEIFSSSYCDNVRNELTTFSLELLHRDPYIKANNVFNIDHPLTASVVRGIIMQLIALLQIKLPDDKNDYFPKLYASETTNITSQMYNNSTSEGPTMII